MRMGAARLSWCARAAMADRRRASYWHLIPAEDYREEDVVADVSDSDRWPEILAREVATVRWAANGTPKVYKWTFLPIRSFAIRYCVVAELAAGGVRGLFSARLGAERMPFIEGGEAGARRAGSLFFGDVDGNGRRREAFKWAARERAEWELFFDVKEFGASVDHARLVARMGEAAPDKIWDVLRHRVRGEDGNVSVNERGITVGQVTDIFFANMAAEAMDDFLAGRAAEYGVESFRRMDDTFVWSNDRGVLERVFEELTAVAAGEGLEVSPKSGIYRIPAMGRFVA